MKVTVEIETHEPYEYMLLNHAKNTYTNYYSKKELQNGLKYYGLPDFLSDFPKLPKSDYKAMEKRNFREWHVTAYYI